MDSLCYFHLLKTREHEFGSTSQNNFRQHGARHRLHRPLYRQHFPIGSKFIAWNVPLVAILTNPEPGYNDNSIQITEENPENMAERSDET